MKSLYELARRAHRNIKPYVPGKPEEQLYRELGLTKVVKLASNENPLGASPKAIRALRQSVHKINRYPEGSAYYLKQRLAKELNVQMETLIIGNGSSEVISLTLQSFADAGDEVIFAHPSFIIYKILAYTVGAVPIEVPLERDFSYNLDAYLKHIGPKTKVIILCNPNNPTGSHIRQQALDWFMEQVPEDVIVISDEAYREYVEDTEFGSAFPWIERKRVVVVRTFSKIYGLASLRVGYGIANREFIAALERIRPPFNTTGISQDAATAAIDDRSFVEKSQKNNAAGKIYLRKELTRLGWTVYPSEANFLFCAVGRNSVALVKNLEKRGIIIREMSSFGLPPEYVRITIGKPSENRLLVKNLREILQS